MTSGELTKRWGVSPEEVQRISETINNNFHLGIIKTGNGFQGVVYKMDTASSGFERSSELIAIPLPCKTLEGASLVLNAIISKGLIKLPPMLVKIMNVPQDAFVALNRFPIPPKQLTKGKCRDI